MTTQPSTYHSAVRGAGNHNEPSTAASVNTVGPPPKGEPFSHHRAAYQRRWAVSTTGAGTLSS